MYIYSFLELVMGLFPDDSKRFLQKFRWQFERIHADELRVLETISLPQQVLENSVTKLYRENKYRIPLNTHTYFNLITYLESNGKAGGTVILMLLQTYCRVIETMRGPIDQYSFEAIISRARGGDFEPEHIQEGIEGGFTGVSNQDIANNNAQLRLGPLQMEVELADDVRAELQEEDAKNPPEAGQQSLTENFEQNIKREESVDAIPRNEIPLPPSKARDVVMEVQKIKENRDRFKIESRTGGIGPGVSVCMFTFHNTLDTYVISCDETPKICC